MNKRQYLYVYQFVFLGMVIIATALNMGGSIIYLLAILTILCVLLKNILPNKLLEEEVK